MNEIEYEITKKYFLSGVDILSEVVKDEAHPEFRALVIRSSCHSHRWGTRTQDYSYTSYKHVPAQNDFAKIFEGIRLQAAETLVKTELGELPERSPRVLGVHLKGSTGKLLNTFAVPDLSFSQSLLDEDMISALELEKAHSNLEVEGQVRMVPLFKAKIIFGSSEIETFIAPSDHGSPPCILGGEFFQKYLRGKGKEDLIQEMLLPDHYRALANAARCQKQHVLIAGKYGNNRARLESIKKVLQSEGFVGLILDEHPDIEEQSLPNKMVTYASICRFVIIDDLVASGHNVELEICHQRKFVTAVLRAKGAASTAMQDDITDEVTFISSFDYDTDDNFESAIFQAAKWADEFVAKRAARLNRKYGSWRGPNRMMGD